MQTKLNGQFIEKVSDEGVRIKYFLPRFWNRHTVRNATLSTSIWL